MLETNPSPVFIQLFKPLFSFRILSLLKDSQITETMPVPSSRVKDDFFLGGGGCQEILACPYSFAFISDSFCWSQKLQSKSDLHKNHYDIFIIRNLTKKSFQREKCLAFVSLGSPGSPWYWSCDPPASAPPMLVLFTHNTILISKKLH